MALPRTDVSAALIDELDRFAALIRPLTDEEWSTPTRCEGWTVGDVARHVVGSMADVAAGRLDGLGSPAVTAREVAQRAGRTPVELADECAEVTKTASGLLSVFDDTAWNAAAPSDYDGTLGDGVEALWYDTWLHGNDIRAALGRSVDLGPGLRGALSHLGTELRKRDWRGPVPAESDATAFEFVLAATGRSDGAAFGAQAPRNVYAD